MAGRASSTRNASFSPERWIISRGIIAAWEKAKASTRETCAGNERVGNLASYIDLLTCVELFEGTVIRPADQQN